jgi:hypothetical protein
MPDRRRHDEGGTYKGGKVMKTGMAWTAAAALLVLAACSRREEPDMNIPGAELNRQTGVLTSRQGIQLNTTSAIGGCLSPEDARRPPSAFPPEQRRQIVACFNSQTADQLNPQLPRQVDQITRLDRLSADGPVLTYYYTVSRSAASLGPTAGQQIEAGIRRMACSQAPIRQTIEMGGAYAYRYVDNQGASIHAFRIDAC